MKFSLVLTTIGRPAALSRCLQALADQEHPDLEVILVDQSADGQTRAVAEEFGGRLEILRVTSARGLSRGRNEGLRHVTGDVVAFPDDDCIYPPDLLRRVAERLQDPELDGVTGRSMDETGREILFFDRRPGLLTRRNALQRVVSYMIFLRPGVVEATGGFDVAMGPGAGTVWGAGEEMDYALRVVVGGFRIHYDPTLVALHPHPLSEGMGPALERARRYRAGFGRLCRKHFSTSYALYSFARTAAGVLVALLTGRRSLAKLRWSGLLGAVEGWRA